MLLVALAVVNALIPYSDFWEKAFLILVAGYMFFYLSALHGTVQVGASGLQYKNFFIKYTIDFRDIQSFEAKNTFPGRRITLNKNKNGLERTTTSGIKLLLHNGPPIYFQLLGGEADVTNIAKESKPVARV